MTDTGGVTELTGKLYVLGVGSETDSGVSLSVAGSDFDIDLETSSRAGTDTRLGSGAGADTGASSGAGAGTGANSGAGAGTGANSGAGSD